MNEQKVIDEIRETYKNTYANCIYVITSKMIGMEEENTKLCAALENIIKHNEYIAPGMIMPTTVIAKEALK